LPRRASHNVRAIRTAVVAALTLLVVALGSPACSASGEGDRCTAFSNLTGPPSNSTTTYDPNALNGTDECQDGLVCYAAANFNIELTGNYDRCCPMVLAQSTVLACQMVGTIDGGNPTSGRDGGADGALDGAIDGAKDGASSETSSDGSSSDSSSKDATKG
jgi:hypothetical protein